MPASRSGRAVPGGTDSFEVRLLRALHPVGEALPVLLLALEVLQDALDVVRKLGRRGLEPPDLPAEAGVHAERPSQVDLEALDLLAAGVGDELALQADVGGLDAGAGVRAAVDVDGQGGGEVGKAVLQ